MVGVKAADDHAYSYFRTYKWLYLITYTNGHVNSIDG